MTAETVTQTHQVLERKIGISNLTPWYSNPHLTS
jgi:hypothetical protein